MLIMETPRFVEISVDGSEAGSFLHSQLTCDVKLLQPGACQFSGYCGADGRVLALLLLARTGSESFRILLPGALGQAVLERLQRYRLRARCTLALTPVEITAATSQAADSWVWQHAGFTWQVRPLAGIAPPELPAGLWDQQVALGIPWLLAQTSERFLPQMLAFERLHAFSLRKGCYPGQEVIARTHFLGRSKRRLARVRATQSGIGMLPGCELHQADSDAAAGTLIVSNAHGDGLAVLVESATLGTQVRVASAPDIATFVIESDVSETIGDVSLNGRCDPPSSA